MTYKLKIRYLVKELSSDGLLKDPEEAIPYSSGTQSMYDCWNGYKTKEDAYEAIHEKEIKEMEAYRKKWGYLPSSKYIILEQVRYVDEAD